MSLKFLDRGLEPGRLDLSGRAKFDTSAGEGDERLLAFVIAAFSTCAKVGLIPQARHGGRGVWAFAAAGSKFEGTGLEKLHMVQTHVADVTGSGGSLGEPSGWGEAAEPLRQRAATLDAAWVRAEERLGGFGTIVILADDFRKPA